MMALRYPLPALLLLTLVPLGTGCLPTFEDAECYADTDCPMGFVCGETTCVRAQPDAGPRDGGFDDAGVRPDAQIRDVGFMDAAAPDATPPDAEVDAGVVDTGVEDTGVVDSGPPDAGFDVRLEPADIDFGVVRIGCPVPSRQFTLRNAGATDVEITSIGPEQGTTGEYGVTARGAPFTLASNGTEMIEVSYEPQNVGVDPGTVEVTWGSPAQLLSSSLTAEGVLQSQRTDNFVQTGGPLDVLFVVHDGPEMTPFQDQLADDLTFLMLVLAYEGWDYQIGVVTADMSATGAQGALQGTPPFVTPQTANVENELAMRIRQGASGAMMQQGLQAAQAALTAPLATTGANAGFLRPEAALLVIFLGNEDDTSPSNVSVYASFFNGLKGAGNEDRVATNVIVSTASFCAVTGGGASYGGRYLGLAPLTGGVIEHICSGTYQSGVSTAPQIVRNPSFVLQAVPNPMTIVVRVDGAAVPSGGGTNWTFDPGTNAVVFSAAATPALGLSVEVDYTIACN